jgi:hypothetical protein
MGRSKQDELRFPLELERRRRVGHRMIEAEWTCAVMRRPGIRLIARMVRRHVGRTGLVKRDGLAPGYRQQTGEGWSASAEQGRENSDPGKDVTWSLMHRRTLIQVDRLKGPSVSSQPLIEMPYLVDYTGVAAFARSAALARCSTFQQVSINLRV